MCVGNIDFALRSCLLCPLQVKAELVGANAQCGMAIAGMTAGSAWQQLKEAGEELQRQHSAAMATVRGADPRHWCASLRAAGNMLVGNFDQVRLPPLQLCIPYE